MNNVENVVPHDDCTGCAACMNVCPVDAIQMAEVEIGHIFPIVSDKCIDCGKCVRICPAINDMHRNTMKQVFASWARNVDEHMTSTSGGVASVAARKIISDGGRVYGCTFENRAGVIHKGIKSLEDVDSLKGSKYVQSHIRYIYRQVSSDLKDGKQVLFIGTGCQVAGLKGFLGKEYNNLLTIGLICHGVPPQRLLFEYLSERGVDMSSVQYISFRQQKNPKYFLKAINADGVVIYGKSIYFDLYYSAFLDSLTIRDSCVRCLYASKERIEDITLGDFHKLGQKIPFNEKTDGMVSLLIGNSEKGQRFIESIKKDIHLFPRSIEEAIHGNPHLVQPPHRRADYKRFVKLYEKKGFIKAAREVLKKRILKNSILWLLANIRK